jgi:hypothetical protein
LKDKPNIFFLISAIILLVCFVFKYLPFSSIISIERKKYSYVINVDQNHKIIIKQGDISSYQGDTNKVILLPANTSFDGKCITDKTSALGSYFLKIIQIELIIQKESFLKKHQRIFTFRLLHKIIQILEYKQVLWE